MVDNHADTLALVPMLVSAGWYVLHYVERIIGYRFDTITRIHCPVLLMHVDSDTTIPTGLMLFLSVYGLYGGNVANSAVEHTDTQNNQKSLSAFIPKHGKIMAGSTANNEQMPDKVAVFQC